MRAPDAMSRTPRSLLLKPILFSRHLLRVTLRRRAANLQVLLLVLVRLLVVLTQRLII